MPNSSSGNGKPNSVVITPSHKSLFQLLVCHGCAASDRDAMMNEFYSDCIQSVGQLIYEKFDRRKYNFTITLPFLEVQKNSEKECLNNYFIDFENKRRDITLKLSTFVDLKEHMEGFAGKWEVTSNGPYYKQQVSIMMDDYNAVLGGAAVYHLSLINAKACNQPCKFIVDGNSKYLKYGHYITGRLWLLGKEDQCSEYAKCFIQDITLDFVKGSMTQTTGQTVTIDPQLSKSFSFNTDLYQNLTPQNDRQLEF